MSSKSCARWNVEAQKLRDSRKRRKRQKKEREQRWQSRRGVKQSVSGDNPEVQKGKDREKDLTKERNISVAQKRSTRAQSG